MKYIKFVGLILLLLIATAAIYIINTPGIHRDPDPGPDFAHEGLDHIKYGKYHKIRQYISLKDGTQLASTILIPNHTDSQKFPVILEYLPYAGSRVVPEMSWMDRIVSKYSTGRWGPDSERSSTLRLNTFISNGYAMAFVDMRGTGSSTGFTGPHDPKHVDDAKEVLEWIAGQSWSNQKIGMRGLSYPGWTQFAAASTKSPYLKCISPEDIFFNLYDEAVRPGGILSQRWLPGYDAHFKSYYSNIWSPENGYLPSEPVIDEDGDGRLYDEIPMIKKNDPSPYTGQLIYADGKERVNHHYAKLTLEHANNLAIIDVVNQLEYIDDDVIYYGDTIGHADASVETMIRHLKETKIPVLLIGGFFDAYSRGMIYSFASLRSTNPTYLFMTPKFHGMMPFVYWEWLDYTYRRNDQQLSMQLQFFDKYLKGHDNGFDGRPPVSIYTAFDGWNFYHSWPPESATSVKFSFGQNHLLSNKVQKDSTYAYQVDFSHSSSYGAHGVNPQSVYMSGKIDSIMIRNEHDKKCLVFETDILDESVIVTGSPIMNLFVSSNQRNADVFVYLSDVDTAGQVHYVSEGKLRAGWHRLFDNDEMVNGHYDVEPELPWHSYKRANYDPKPFDNDSIVNLTFDLKPHSWKFREGHRIRLSIAGADYENYEFNPELCPDNTQESCRLTKLNIHTGEGYHSYLELPVVE